MLCPKCGTENSDLAESCVHCHEPMSNKPQPIADNNQQHSDVPDNPMQTKVADVSDAQTSSATRKDSEDVPARDKPVVSAGVNIAIIIGTILFPVIGIAMGYTYLRKDHPEAQKAGKNWLILGAVMLLVNIFMVSFLK